MVFRTGRNMDSLLARVVPRLWWHWPLSLLLWGGIATLVAHFVDIMIYGEPDQTILLSFPETVLTAAPLVIFALLLVRHANQLRHEAMFMASHDPLTGLLNRRAFLAELGNQQGGALYMLDLDHFKQVNDTYGHLVGDDVLCVVAAAMTTAVRSGDIVGRLGGEEFAIFAPGLHGDAAHALGERLVQGAQHVEPFSNSVIRVTISVGGYWTDRGVDTTTLLRKADHALYEAKAAGRARIVWYVSESAFAARPPSAVA
ncbi:diguanylate cyclase (GGDEF) domain-containing protein [Yoonia tamlensis]|uniref:diguanylate cyclase n=1 Tax=Yoonia tamlensis TaxID=390270 RepID=A0A1I6GGH5_9RHOB|nr:GGDEF domain-containing protein [Yoonia tamlensis]SFR41323.1 diguanylate cyclase (GGDEF) domain-containing protein [Yoonia tamlensis]